jgi:hypothetical protein
VEMAEALMEQTVQVGPGWTDGLACCLAVPACAAVPWLCMHPPVLLPSGSSLV